VVPTFGNLVIVCMFAYDNFSGPLR